jgi:ribonuclease R
MISTVTNFGMFIQLDNLIEGLVKINELNGFYDYNEESQMLIDEKTHNMYRLGDKVVVKVVRASKEEKTIDFEIVKKL